MSSKAPQKSTSWSGVFAKSRTSRPTSSSGAAVTTSSTATTPTSMQQQPGAAQMAAEPECLSDLLSDGVDEWDTDCVDSALPEKSSDLFGMSSNLGPLRRKVSVSRLMYTQVSIKEGWLYKQPRSFQRVKKRYFWLKRNKLYYGRTPEDSIVSEIDLTSVSIAECTAKANQFSFQLITPRTVLMLSADSRQTLDEWMQSLKSTTQQRRTSVNNSEQYTAATSGEHTWFVSSHNRPVYCNVCREALAGVAWHGLGCEVCKMKVHKRCAMKVPQRCKWSTLPSVAGSFDQQFVDLVGAGSSAAEDAGPTTKIMMPHQWVEGNLPMSSKCALCDRACGSVMRLQDFSCLWCHACVHSCCMQHFPNRCTLGSAHLSVLPPVSVRSVNPDGVADVCAKDLSSQSSRNTALPLVVFVNTKSGDTQGLRVLRQCKRLLNPLQVYDLINGGPEFGLRLFSCFTSFRVLACGGDGTVGWVLSAIDSLQLHAKCYVGILPLGTGNDLSRVLGWGHSFDDTMRLSQLLKSYERAQTGMLDRWSVLTHQFAPAPTDGKPKPEHLLLPRQSHSVDSACLPSSSIVTMDADTQAAFGRRFECSVDSHISRIHAASDDATAISSARVLCETIKTFLVNVGEIYRQSDESHADDDVAFKCSHLQQKLDNLLKALRQESLRVQAQREESGIEQEETSSDDAMPDLSPNTSQRFKHRRFVQREHLMMRANSLKKAVKDIVDHADRVVDSAQAGSAPARRRSRRQRQQRAYNRQNREVKTSSPVKPLVSSQQSTPQHVSSALFNYSPPLSPIETFAPETEQTTSGVAMTTSSSTAAVEWSAAGLPLYTTSDACDDDTSSCDVLAVTESASPIDLFSDGADKSTLEQEGTDVFPVRCHTHHSDPNLRDLEIGDSSPELCLSRHQVLDRKHSFASSSAHGSPASTLPDLLESLQSGEPSVPDECFAEKHVMNNYFGIGLDAKIALEFHRKREEYASASRSRSKLYIWYGMLGGKELWKRTYRNLERRVHLTCDGRPIKLPALQGLVILNIPSYQGGMNFWGSSTTSGKRKFLRQSFDDRILEVVAVYGVMHCATSRVVKLQNHRIAQCREVVVRVTGSQPVAMQVDGEPWMQPPGIVRIVHKNRAHVLIRNPRFDESLRTWDEQQLEPSHRVPRALAAAFVHDECQLILAFIWTAQTVVECVEQACAEGDASDPQLQSLAAAATNALDRLYPPHKKLDVASTGPVMMRRSLPLVYYYPGHHEQGTNNNTCSPLVYMIANMPQQQPQQCAGHKQQQPPHRRQHHRHCPAHHSNLLMPPPQQQHYDSDADYTDNTNTADYYGVEPEDSAFAPGSLMLFEPKLYESQPFLVASEDEDDSVIGYDNLLVRRQGSLAGRARSQHTTPTHISSNVRDAVVTVDALTDHLWQDRPPQHQLPQQHVQLHHTSSHPVRSAATTSIKPAGSCEHKQSSPVPPTASAAWSSSTGRTLNYKNRADFYKAVDQLQQELNAVAEILDADKALGEHTQQQLQSSSSVPVVVQQVPDRPSGEALELGDSPDTSSKRIIRSQSDRPIYASSQPATDTYMHHVHQQVSVQRSSTDTYAVRKQRQLQNTELPRQPGLSAGRIGKWLRSAAGKLKPRRRSTSSQLVLSIGPTAQTAASGGNAAVELWTVDQVCDWLRQQVQLTDYVVAFEQHEIGGHELLRLNRHDLRDMGVLKVGHIKRIESGIVRLCNEDRSGSATHNTSREASLEPHLQQLAAAAARHHHKPDLSEFASSCPDVHHDSK